MKEDSGSIIGFIVILLLMVFAGIIFFMAVKESHKQEIVITTTIPTTTINEPTIRTISENDCPGFSSLDIKQNKPVCIDKHTGEIVKVFDSFYTNQ